MLPELAAPLDAALIRRKRPALRRRLLAGGPFLEKRIAVLGGSTTAEIVGFLELFLLDAGIKPTFYQSDYGMYYEDAVFGNAALDAFAPELVFVHTSVDNIQAWPSPDMDADAVDALFADTLSRYEAVWESIEKRYACPVIQNNFEMPYYRILGNADASDIHGRVHFVERLNAAFADRAAHDPSLFIHDVHWLSASVGLENWANRKHWHMYKSAMDLSLVPRFCQSLSFIIKALYGLNKKAVALDLDNTLWGGVIGDDGQDGIRIGAGSAEGEAYHEFQSYLNELKRVGILLTVNSKNERENAMSGLMHPAGVLKADDFAAIYANWENKDKNIADTAAALNIGADAIVFVDDNPAERALVSASLPFVAVPEMTEPENYVKELDRGGYFESIGISADDLKRSDMYRVGAARKQAETAFADYDAYLKSLEMTAEVREPNAGEYARVAQLINKTNQFNLTALRLSEPETTAYIEHGNSIALMGRLADRFGDNGLVSVLLGRMGGENGETLYIDLFVMSCRVFRRGLEDAMMNALVARAKARGAKRIEAKYVPTAKNGGVKELYAQYGFVKSHEDADGTAHWSLETAQYREIPTMISIQNQTEM